MGNKDKDKDKDHYSEAEAIGEGESTANKEAQNACQANRDLSHEREAALKRQIAEAVTRETAKVTAHFQALLDERTTLNLACSLKVTSGAAVAQDIFRSKLDAIFIGMEGVTGIADDMVIAGRDEMEHDRNFLEFMEKCMINNLTLNAEKIQFKQTQLSFYGHYWLKQGISLDPEKIETLNHVDFPPDKETMRSFLWMVNYLNQYSALSAHLCQSLSALTHQAINYKPSKVAI